MCINLFPLCSLKWVKTVLLTFTNFALTLLTNSTKNFDNLSPTYRVNF